MIIDVATIRVSKSTRDELDRVHKLMRSKDSRIRSKDKVILALIELYDFNIKGLPVLDGTNDEFN